MCRYAAKTYKSHYACFNCRKAFKQAHVADILLRVQKDKVFHELNGKSIRKVGQVFTKGERHKLRDLVSEIRVREVKCPQCAGIMANLGLDFKAPKQTAVKEWKIVEGLFVTGKEFYSCGCDGIGYIPQNPRDYEAYLNKALNHYRAGLKRCQDSPREAYGDKNAELAYWAGRIDTIGQEIARQKPRT